MVLVRVRVKDQFQHHLVINSFFFYTIIYIILLIVDSNLIFCLQLVPEYHVIHPKQKRAISAVVNNRVNLINGLRLVLAGKLFCLKLTKFKNFELKSF